MSSGGLSLVVMGESSRVSIPSGVRKMVEEIMDITRNNCLQEVYSMLRACSMDPNETVERLLLQDPFHVVQGKRNKKRNENNTNTGGKQHHLSHSPAAAGSRARNNTTTGRGRGNFPASRFLSNGKKKPCHASNRERFSFRSLPHDSSGSETTTMPAVWKQQQQLQMGGAHRNPPSKPCLVDVKGTQSKAASKSKFSSSRGIANDAPKLSCTRKAHSPDADLSPSSNQTIASNTITSHFQGKPAQITSPSNHLQPGADKQKASLGPNKEPGRLHFSNHNRVIFPNHIGIPEAESVSIIFGSFHTSFLQKSTPVKEVHAVDKEDLDASFTQKSSPVKEIDTDKDSNAEAAQDLEESAGETPSPHIATVEVEDEVASECVHPSEEIIEVMSSGEDKEKVTCECLQSSEELIEAMPSEDVDVSSAGSQPDSYKVETILVSDIPVSQHSVVQQTVPACSTSGLKTPELGDQSASHENPEPHSCDASHLSGIVSGNPPAQLTPGPSSVSSQGVGVMSTTSAVQQFPLPTFQQPTSLHMSHCPNSIPYSQHFSPFYLPPQNIHHPLPSSATFPQQHPAGNIYPPHLAPASAPLCFSQFKAGGNNGSSWHAGFTTGFAPPRSSWANYNLTPTTSVTDLTRKALIPAHLSAQQSEGLIVTNPLPGRDMSGLQANPFYPAPMAFQGHAPYPGIYHPALMGATAPFPPLLQRSQNVA